LGQKVNPIGLRLGGIKTWYSQWFSEKNYSELLHEDIKIRKYLKEKLYHAGISRIEIERAANKAKVNIHAARPGIIIGKKGSEIEKLKKDLEGITSSEVIINILEVRKPEIDAQLVAENVAHEEMCHRGNEVWRKGNPGKLRWTVGWSRNGQIGMVSGGKGAASYAPG
jgi:small subunit ribosomal protein S3